MNAALDPTAIAVIAAALVGAILLLFLVHQTATGASKHLRNRVTRINLRWVSASDAEAASLRLNADSSFPMLDAIMRRIIPRPGLMRQRLAKTGKKISLGQYALICLSIAIGASAARSVFFDFPLLLAILFGVAAGAGLPHYAVGHLIKRREKKFLAEFSEAIDLIVRGLKSGLPVPESIQTVGDEFDGTVGDEFRRVSDTVKIGQSLDNALLEAAKRIDLADFRFFIISLSVQRETGGNLAETLENLAEILRRRRQMVLKIRAMSSEAKASAIIIGSLPFIMFAILYLVSGDYVMGLFSDPRGLFMVGVGFAFLAVGVAVMIRMVKFEI